MGRTPAQREQNRKFERKKVDISAIIRKEKADGGYAIMEFRCTDLSLGGVFISTESLDLFTLGDEFELLVDTGGKKYYEGSCRVVRSARVFSEDEVQLDSGFGLMFINPSKDFKTQLEQKMK